jgi:hypothetical protein
MRSGLTRKIETLEREVFGTVRGTRDAVTETVQTVKDTVQSTVANVKDTITETVDAVKDTFNLPLQTQRHPWAVFGGSIGVGFLLGSSLPAKVGSQISTGLGNRMGNRIQSLIAPTVAPTPPAGRGQRGGQEVSEHRSFWSGLAEQFQPEFEKLKGIAIGAAANVIRDVLKKRVPEPLAPHVHGLVHDVSEKLGGEKIEGSLLGEEQEPHLARRGNYSR